MTDFKPDFDTEADSGQDATEVATSEPQPAADEPREALIDQDGNEAGPHQATYDVAWHNSLPGVDVSGSLPHRPHGQPH